MQLVQPTTWDTADPVVLLATQTSATELIEAVGTATVCPVFEMRVFDCNLQFSVDGGVTWVTVTDWATFLSTCIPAQVGIGIPPNPQGATMSQLACNIAAYLASDVIQASINQAVSDITAMRTLIQFGIALIALIPGADIPLELIAGAGGALYLAITAGTLSDYSSALSDATLWSNVTCEIYDAIAPTGYVTAMNFSTILSNIAGIGYVHPAVITTIHDYVSNLGVIGLLQLQQIGALNVGDCSGCATWCYEFYGGSEPTGFAYDPPTEPWVYPSFGLYGVLAGHAEAFVGSRSDAVSGTLGENWTQLALNDPSGVNLTYVEVHWTASGANPFSSNVYEYTGGSTNIDNTAGSHIFIDNTHRATNHVGFNIAASDGATPGTVDITYVKVKGTYPALPLGANTCAP